MQCMQLVLKKMQIQLSMEELKKIRENVSLPIVVIGGINKERIKDFEGMGIDGLAIVSAIIAQKDIVEATRELKRIFTQG